MIIMIVTDSSFLGKVYDQVSRDDYESCGQQLSRSVMIIMVVYILARSMTM